LIPVTLEPGATAGDPNLPAAVSPAVAVAAEATYPLLRAGMRSTAALVLAPGRARPPVSTL
jgi:hypothetical protein